DAGGGGADAARFGAAEGVVDGGGDVLSDGGGNPVKPGTRPWGCCGGGGEAGGVERAVEIGGGGGGCAGGGGEAPRCAWRLKMSVIVLPMAVRASVNAFCRAAACSRRAFACAR